MGSLSGIIKNHQSEDTSRYQKILAIFKETDRKIEKWVSRFIDELEEADHNRNF